MVATTAAPANTAAAVALEVRIAWATSARKEYRRGDGGGGDGGGARLLDGLGGGEERRARRRSYSAPAATSMPAAPSARRWRWR